MWTVAATWTEHVRCTVLQPGSEVWARCASVRKFAGPLSVVTSLTFIGQGSNLAGRQSVLWRAPTMHSALASSKICMQAKKVPVKQMCGPTRGSRGDSAGSSRTIAYCCSIAKSLLVEVEHQSHWGCSGARRRSWSCTGRCWLSFSGKLAHLFGYRFPPLTDLHGGLIILDDLEEGNSSGTTGHKLEEEVVVTLLVKLPHCR